MTIMRGNGGKPLSFSKIHHYFFGGFLKMPFNLIMGRKLFTVVNDLCDKYEEKFKEKVATASVVNVLIAEALIHRGLIPPTYIREHYGCDSPIEEGFTPNARKEIPKHVLEQEQARILQVEKTLTEAYKIWETLKPPARQYHLKIAQQYCDLPISQLILKAKGDISNE